MIILEWFSLSREKSSRNITLLFGIGLLGSAILSALQARVAIRRTVLPFAWPPSTDWVRQGDAISSLVRRLAQPNSGEAVSIDVIWSAGKAGFASSEEVVAAEDEVFGKVVDIASGLQDEASIIRFHFLSSAGGLFEGNKLVDAGQRPAPLRPYGLTKLSQEDRLGALAPRTSIIIYRPSSVYGYAGPRGRKGLVAALVQNAVLYRTTAISGTSDTIRDYVFADDVGEFIASRLLGRERGNRTYLLASGKATSMVELTAVVQNVVQRQLYFQFEPRPSNALNISFRPNALPEGWRATALPIGVYKTAERILAAYRQPTR